MEELVDSLAKLFAAGDVKGGNELIAAQSAEPTRRAMLSAVAAMYQRDADATIAFADQAIAGGAGAVAHQYAALGQLLAGDVQQAIDHARKAIGLDGRARYRGFLGSVLLQAKRWEDAAAVLRQVADEEPNNFDIQMSLGAASAQLGDYGEAIVRYSKSFEINPSDARPLQNLIGMFADVGRWLGASAALDLSRNGDPPPEVEVALDLCSLHITRLIAVRFPKHGIADDVDKTVANAIEHSQRRSPAMQITVARTLIDLHRVDEARKIVDRLAKVQLEPQDRGHVCYLRGLLAEQKGDKRGAADLYAQALAADGQRIDALINASSLMLEANDLDKLEQLFAGATPGAQRVPEVLLNQAVFLERRGKRAESRAQLERILELTKGEGPIAATARKALAER